MNDGREESVARGGILAGPGFRDVGPGTAGAERRRMQRIGARRPRSAGDLRLASRMRFLFGAGPEVSRVVAFFAGLVCLALSVAVPRTLASVPAVRQVLVVDSEADVFGDGDARGAVIILGYDTPTLRIATNGVGFKDPVSVVSAPDRLLFVADASADPFDLGSNLGAVWRADPSLNTVAPPRIAGASSLFRRLADVVQEPEGTLLVLDRDADPAGWGFRNGALFRVDPTSNNVEVLAAPSVFDEPRGLTFDRDGTVLVVDPLADPLSLPNAAGAIFRIHPRTGATTLLRALTSPTFAYPVALAVIDHGPWEGDYLLVDKDADPRQRGTRPGAVYRLPRDGGPPVFFSDSPLFDEPIDILVGVREDVLVLEQSAGFPTYPLGRGGVFRFRLADGLEMGQPWGSNTFRRPEGFIQLASGELDSSLVAWQDESPGFTTAGDLFTVRARLRNTGTADAPSVSLADTVRAPFHYIAGSDSFGLGRGGYNPTMREFVWNGSLDQGDSTTVRFRVRLGEDAAPGTRYTQQLTLRVDRAPSVFRRPITPWRDFVPGVSAFADVVPTPNGEQGLLYLIGADSLNPAALWQGDPLDRPSDLVFLDDGRLVALDPSSPEGELGAIILYSTFYSDTVRVGLRLTRADGFVSPAGLGLGRDGSLLLIDRNANPSGWSYTPNPAIGDTGPGAVFRINPDDWSVEVVAAEALWREPVDALVDRTGAIVVLDYEGGDSRQGSVWEVRPGLAPIEFILDSRFFRDPAGMACNITNDLFICDPAFGGGLNPNGGAVFRLRRGTASGLSVATADSRLIRPSDCAVGPDGTVLITDREANPHALPPGDRGAVFRLNPANGRLEVEAATAYLRQPDGAVVLGYVDLQGSRLQATTPSGGNPTIGDTLRFDLAVVNRGTRAAPHATATLTFTESLQMVVLDPPPDGISFDPQNARVAWTGRVAGGDTVAVAVRATVRSGVSYGAAVGAEAQVNGGPGPVMLTATRTVRAPFVPNEVLLADLAADPNRLGVPYGAIYHLGEEGGEPVRLVYSNLALRRVSALEFDRTGNLIVTADRGSETGRIYRFNSLSGGLVQFAGTDTFLKSPSDLLYAPGGDLLIVDREAPGPTPSSRGVIFRKSNESSPLVTFAADSMFRAPEQAVFGPDGRLYLADPGADPDRVGGDTGAIFILDPQTGAVLDWVQSTGLREPTGVAVYDDSTLIITDPVGAGGGNGSLMLYRIYSGVLAPLVSLSEFESVWRSLRSPSGELLVLDRLAVAPGQAGTPGVVFGYDPASRRLRYYAKSDSFALVTDLARKPGPVVRLARYDVEDENGAPLHSADVVACRGLLRNAGATVAAGVAYADTLPAEVSLVPGSATASAGALTVIGDRIVAWTGSLAPGDSVDIRYQAQLNPALAEGRLLQFEAVVTAPVVGSVRRSVDLQTQVPLEPGYLYLADSEANPFSQPQQTGAIFKVNLVTGAVTPMVTSPEFRKPRSLALVGSASAPKLLILDRNARNQHQRLGTLFLYDPVTRDLQNLGGDSTWVSPARVLEWTDTEALMLDTAADPFGLTPEVGPGAIYRVDLETGQTAAIASDTLFKQPMSMCWAGPSKLAVVDAEADPRQHGNKNGAVFEVDLTTSEVRTFASSQLWRTPRAIAARTDGGGFVVADRDATPYNPGGGYGSLHSISGSGQSTVLTVSPLFASLNDVAVDADGHPVVTDENTDPYAFGERPGGILRWNPAVNGRMVPLASSPFFRNPEGFVLLGGIVPVAVLEAAASAVSDGIRLEWRGHPEATAARYLVYRRLAEGAEDPGDPDPSRSELVSGAGDFLGPGPHSFLDAEVASEAWYAYLIVRIDPDGAVSYSHPLLIQAPQITARLQLRRPMPTPFAERTTIRFSVPAPGGRVELALFDLSGRRVRVLWDAPSVPGSHAVVWDGRDDGGRRVASGIYFARLAHRGEERTARVVRLK